MLLPSPVVADSEEMFTTTASPPRLSRGAKARIVENGPRTFVSAPFFGEQVAKKPYPKFEFLPDYREFFRAYKCCFLDWLRKSGDKTSPEASETKFRELLKKLNGRAPDVTYEAVVQQIYGPTRELSVIAIEPKLPPMKPKQNMVRA